MAKTSKMTANRLTVSRTVHSSVATHGEEIGDALAAALFPKGPPAKLTVAQVVTAIGDVLARADSAVAAADLAHSAELSDDEPVRVERQAAEANLREKLLRKREFMSGAHGVAVTRAYGLDGALPESAQQLLLLSANVETLLRTRPLTEKPVQAGVTIQPKLLADDLQVASQALQTALAAIKREEREAQLTLEGKNRAGEAWQSAYQAVSSTLSGLYLLAGRKDLAERVTPTARRRAGLPEEGDVPQPTPTPPPMPDPQPK